MTYIDELDESENSNEKLNVCGSVKSIQERFDDIEYAYETSIEFSEIALKNIADKITFGRAYIESIEKYLMAYQE